MIKQPNMKMIGLFILFSLFIAGGGIVYLLKSKFSTSETTVVMFFDESVKGLDVGAPVLFKGVKIGEVSAVRLKANLQTMKFLILVYAKIYNGKSLITDTIDERERLNRFIKEGLRARLAVNSIITGQLLIELDMFPDTKAVLHQELNMAYEIPTLDSPFAEISKKLQVMPVAKIAQDIQNITDNLENQLPVLLDKMTSTLTTVDTILNENKSNTSQMVNQLGSVAQSMNIFVGENAMNISAMIESFTAAATSMKNLTDYLQINPSSIITGKGY